MLKLVLVVFLVGALAGAMLAFRWLRGETEYEAAVRELEHEPQSGESVSPP